MHQSSLILSYQIRSLRPALRILPNQLSLGLFTPELGRNPSVFSLKLTLSAVLSPGVSPVLKIQTEDRFLNYWDLR